MRKYTKSSKNKTLEWLGAPDIKKRVDMLIDKLGEEHFIKNRIFCFRSHYANTRAIARIWGLGRVWQQALGIKPAYVLEVISERFDRMSEYEKDKVLLHEIAHIPSNFSGSLIPHIRRGKRNFYDKVKRLINKSLYD